MDNREKAHRTAALAIKAVAASLLLAGASSLSAQADESGNRSIYAGRFDPFRGKTLEQKIQELADREEIRDLIATYAHRVAHGLSIADLFTDDGVYINRRSPNGPPSESRGRQALEARWPNRPDGAGNSMPMIHNHLYAINGDHATGMCSNELRITENGKSMIASGYYEDRLRRENGRWRFVERKVTFFHWVPIQEGWANATRQK